MFINFGFEDFNIETYIIEIKIGNQIQKQAMQGDSNMVQLQFIQLLKQAGNSNQPIKLSISKMESIWCQIDNKIKEIENKIVFLNKIYMSAYPEEVMENTK